MVFGRGQVTGEPADTGALEVTFNNREPPKKKLTAATTRVVITIGNSPTMERGRTALSSRCKAHAVPAFQDPLQHINDRCYDWGR